MKKYTFELTLLEGCDEFWEDILEDGKCGADELMLTINGILDSSGFTVNTDCLIKLTKFEDK